MALLLDIVLISAVDYRLMSPPVYSAKPGGVMVLSFYFNLGSGMPFSMLAAPELSE